MKRLITTLAATVAALAASAGAAFAAGPVQSGTQSSSTTQGAVAASSATQIQPSNQNISVRVLSPGNDGPVSQSNTASSSADATNTASTTQSASQTGSGCGCIVKSGRLDDVLGTAMQAAAPAPGGVQSTTQDADTTQVAAAGSSTLQDHPSNTNISVRVLSEGDDGNVTQSNEASSSADATNSAATTQGSTQNGAGTGGVQSATQDADTTQGSLAESSAKQVHPENTNTSVRVLSPSKGHGGSVSQRNEAESSANATNTAPVGQSVSQNQAGDRCGCHSGGPAVQAVGQSSEIAQAAKAASSAEQIKPENTNEPVRVWSEGNDGRVHQSNEVSSEANAENTAPVTQTGAQQQAGGSCGCSKDPAVQALGQSSDVGQLALGLSSAKQIGATNDSAPVRVYSDGGGGSVSQRNEAESSADASNNAPVSQTGRQAQSGSGVQALGQDSSIGQIAFAGSSAAQLPGRSDCGCGHSFGNSADPVRVWSDGNDGRLKQENEASSEATAANTAAPTQTGTQTQASPSCGCGGLGVQALGQYATVDQLAAALSSTHQIGAKNSSGPARVWSTGGGGSTRQSNEAESSSTAPNVSRILQTGQQMMV